MDDGIEGEYVADDVNGDVLGGTRGDDVVVGGVQSLVPAHAVDDHGVGPADPDLGDVEDTIRDTTNSMLVGS